MKIKRQLFCEILGMLEEENIIDNFTFGGDENKVCVYARDNTYKKHKIITYYFDEKNELIDPHVGELQKQLNELEKQKKDLENKIKQLTNS